MNVFEFAMQMEVDGKAYYEKLSSEATNAGLKTIFTNLASDEQKHFETFRALKGGLKGEFTESRSLEVNKNLFQALIADDSNSDILAHSLDGYRLGMDNESKSIAFYEDAAKKESDPETVKLLLRIAEEEKGHFQVLENLYQYTLAPQNYLAWGEFGNLKEL